MPLIKDKYKGDHSRSKYLRNNQVIKNPQVESQYQTTDQKLVSQSKDIQDTTSNVVGTQSIFGYNMPQNSLTSIGSINPGEMLDFINLSYKVLNPDASVSVQLLWSTAKPSDVSARVESGAIVTVTKGNLFFMYAGILDVSSIVSKIQILGRVTLDDFKIANPKKTIYLYAAASTSTLSITVAKNEYTNK